MTTTSLPHRAVASAPLARGPVRPLYALAGVALLGVAVWGSVVADTGVSTVLLFAVLPDIALLLAVTGDHQPGQLPRTAVPAYNALHHPLAPVAIGTAAATGLVGTYWLVAATTWGAHIALDRAAGYGLRTKDGWQRG